MNADEDKAILDALEFGRSELLVQAEDGPAIIRRLKRRCQEGWRFFLRGHDSDEQTRIIIMSPACQDPPPPVTHRNHYSKPAEPEKPKKKGPFDSWIIANLTTSSRLFITVLPESAIKKAGSVGKCEQLLTAICQQEMEREDIRVMIQCSGKHEYNARLIFLENERK